MCGAGILVAPVLRPEVAHRGVFLPAGDWYDFWTGQRHTGSRGIGVPVTLSSIPIFIRGGAFVFGQPVVQHTGEMAGKPLQVTLFPGGNSERWLYEDAGNGFEYQRGGFARRRFSTHRDGDATVVEIGSPDGSYRPQPRALQLTIPTQAERVSVRTGSAAAASLTRLTEEDFAKADRGWTARNGAVVIKVPDRFE